MKARNVMPPTGARWDAAFAPLAELFLSTAAAGEERGSLAVVLDGRANALAECCRSAGPDPVLGVSIRHACGLELSTPPELGSSERARALVAALYGCL